MNLDHLLTSLSALYDVRRSSAKYSGVIVALEIPSGVAQAHAVPGGLPADEMHVTLAFLGEIGSHPSALPFLNLARSLSDLAAQTSPVEAHFGGKGCFEKVADGKDACYLSVDAPGLPSLREQVVQVCRAAGLPEDTTHGFTPHMTVAYTEHGAPHPSGGINRDPFTFTKLGLWIGGNRVNFPFRVGAHLTASVPFSKADQGQPPEDDLRSQAQQLLAQLGGDLRTVEHQETQAQQVAEYHHQRHSEQFEQMARAIPAPRGSELEAAALHHAGEAAAAERLAVIP